MSFGGQQPTKREPGLLIFHPMRSEEYNIPPMMGMGMPPQYGTRPQYQEYVCSECGSAVHGRIVCDLIKKSDGHLVLWCLCPCEGATIIEKDGDQIIRQVPASREFRAGGKWPTDLARLFDEAAKAYSAQAYTVSALGCRKLLMACACHEDSQASAGDPAKKTLKDGQAFTDYVDYIVGIALPFPRARASIDAIRTIGNDATHKIDFVTQPDAERAMKIVTYMLDALYSLPTA